LSINKAAFKKRYPDATDGNNQGAQKNHATAYGIYKTA